MAKIIPLPGLKLSTVLRNYFEQFYDPGSPRPTGTKLRAARAFIEAQFEEHGIMKVNDHIMGLLEPLVQAKKHCELTTVARTLQALNEQRLASSMGWLLFHSPHARPTAEKALSSYRDNARFARGTLETMLNERLSPKVLNVRRPWRDPRIREHVERKKAALRVIAAMGAPHNRDFFGIAMNTLGDIAHSQYLPELNAALAAMDHGPFERLIEHSARARGWREPRRR